MVFSSVFFLSVFLPITLACYFLVPKALRNGVLLMASLIFYSWGEPVYILLMFYSTILDYCCGLSIERYRNDHRKSKLFLLVSLIGNLGMLGFFKYYNFFASNLDHFLHLSLPLLKLGLPIGISFYTFQTMSYTIDVYRGNCKTQHNIISFGCYVTMFPQLIAGPIVRYVDVVKEIDDRKETVDEFAQGIRIFAVGLGKKVLLANAIGSLWDQVITVFQMDPNISVATAWLGILAFAFQLYFDFSGYSDMAIGMGHMFGFKFPQNFNYPYISTSISDFWRRWHMTLGTIFREYVYIPLGGNRKGKRIWLRNVMIVWFLTGLWHGANWNFVLWGLYFGVLLVLEKIVLNDVLKKLPVIVRWLYTMLAVIISWVLFSIESLPLGLSYLKVMFGMMKMPLIDRFALYQWSNYGLLFGILIIASTPSVAVLAKKLEQWFHNRKKETVFGLFQLALCILILFASMAYLVDASYNPFLYFRF